MMRGASLARASMQQGVLTLRTIIELCRRVRTPSGKLSIWMKGQVRRPIFLFMLIVSGCAGTGPGATPAATPAGGSGGGTTFPWSSSGGKFGYVRSDVIAQRVTDYRDVENAHR